MTFLAILSGFLFLQLAHSFDTPNCHGDRTVIVHLFSWNHEDIAQECERWLGPKGFCGVQLTPPNEHREVTNSNPLEHRPWWERYQPVSYILGSRSGNREQFIDMVNRCEAVGVRIYGDMVINHMTGSDGVGVGSAGSSFNAEELDFPGVPYTPDDFNCCTQSMTGNCVDGYQCDTNQCMLEDFNNTKEMRDCRLFGLVGLALHIDTVRQKVRDAFDDQLSLGVAGFRVDACRHMWPEDLENLYSGMTMPDGSQPFIFNEVIDLRDQTIKGEEYFHLGRVTEFMYGFHMFGAFRGYFPLANLEDFGSERWGLYPSDKSLVFVDNHDNQRGHGAGGENILSFWEARPYTMASMFKLAHPFGFVRIMSSYQWEGGRFENDGQGPPTDDGENIKTVVINEDESCGDGSEHTWVCEHRWRPIANMVEWRNVAGGEGGTISNWWTNGNNQIAFSRNGRAFIAFNNEGLDLMQTLQTGLPDGEYCNIAISDYIDCSDIVTVLNGEADIGISGSAEVPVVAFHTGPGSLIRKY